MKNGNNLLKTNVLVILYSEYAGAYFGHPQRMSIYCSNKQNQYKNIKSFLLIQQLHIYTYTRTLQSVQRIKDRIYFT
jgi:hypothetical protein